MARIFITGSSDGLGLLAAKRLVANGNTVYLHARNETRAADARKACPGAAGVLLGDLSSIPETKALAEAVSKLGSLDCVVHNAGLYLGPYREQADGYPSVFAVNVLAPYLLTCLTPLPRRLVYVSSDSHFGGSTDLQDFGWRERGRKNTFSPGSAYADTKIYNVMFGYAFARRFADRGVTANSVDPGWVPTRMGGASAPGSLEESERLYTMLAQGSAEAEGKTGCYWEPGSKGPARAKATASDETAQEALLKKLEEVTGVKLP